MALTIHCFCAFPDHAGAEFKFDADDRAAQKIDKAVKGEDFVGYGYIENLKGDRVKFTNASTIVVADIFADWAIQRLKSLGIRTAALIPIPSPTQTEFNVATPSRRLADAIERKNASYAVAPVLAWNDSSQSSYGLRHSPHHQRRSKSYGALLAQLKSPSDIALDHAILVDDELTTGKQMRACANFLRSLGTRCETGLCVGRRVRRKPEDVYQIEPFDLEMADF